MSTSNNAPPAVAKPGPFGAKDFVNLYSLDEFGIWSEKRRQAYWGDAKGNNPPPGPNLDPMTDSPKSKFKNHGLNDKETR
jgi:hypothetical protein